MENPNMVAPAAPQAPAAPAAPVAPVAVAPPAPVAVDPNVAQTVVAPIAVPVAAPVVPAAPTAPAAPIAVAPAPVAAPIAAPVAAPVAAAPMPTPVPVGQAPAPMIQPIVGNIGGEFDSAVAGVDYSQVDDSGGLVPSHYPGPDGKPGDQKIIYEGQIMSVKNEKTKDGSPMAKVKIQIVWPREHAGVTLIDNLVAQENTQWKVKSFYKAIGFLDASGRVAAPIAQSIGRVLAFTTKQEEYNNITRSKIDGTYQAATNVAVG